MNRYFYTGSYASGAGIHLISLDTDTGKLRILRESDAVVNPSYVILSRDSSRLYALSEQDDRGSISVFSCSDGLSPLGSMPTTGGATCHLAIHPEGTWLAAANYLSGTVDLFSLDPDGSLGRRTCTVQHRGQGAHPDRQQGPHAHCVAFVPGQPQELLTVDLGTDRLDRYRISEGQLLSEGGVSFPAGTGPRHLVFSAVHPGLFYVISELGNQVFTLRLQENSISILDCRSVLPDSFAGYAAASAIRLSGDGQLLYAGNRVYTPATGLDSIAVFPLSPETGLPGSPEFFPTGAREPRDFDLLGEFLITACQSGNRVQAFRMKNGRPAEMTDALTMDRPCCIAAVP